MSIQGDHAKEQPEVLEWTSIQWFRENVCNLVLSPAMIHPNETFVNIIT